MSGRITQHLRSNVVGYVAIFLFAIGGTAYATHGAPNSISTIDIINGEVKTADIGTGEVGTADIANDGVTTIDIVDDAVTQNKIIAGGVRTSEIANGQVMSIDVQDNGLGGIDITDGGLTGADIANDSIGPAQTTGLVGSSQVVWAVVNADGTVDRSSHGATGTLQGTGNYEIAMNAGNLDGCASVAQISRSDFDEGAPGPGEAASGQGEDLETNIDVRTFDSAGTATDNEFTVHVLCSGAAGAGPTNR